MLEGLVLEGEVEGVSVTFGGLALALFLLAFLDFGGCVVVWRVAGLYTCKLALLSGVRGVESGGFVMGL